MHGLRELLAENLLSAMPTDRRVLLWLDPCRDFQRLWPKVSETLTAHGVRCLECDHDLGSQLALKVELLGVGAADETPVVVYLPGFGVGDLQPRSDGTAPELWSVYEYRYKGSLWTPGGADVGTLPEPPSLVEFLEANGISFVDEGTRSRLAEGGPDSMLAIYAFERMDTDLIEWPTPIRESDVVRSLGGDPRESLRELVASPKNSMRRWRDVSLTLHGISQRFGLEVPRKGDDPEEIADAFLVQLALTEAWEAFGRPEDFPFSARLPETHPQREQAIRFLRQDVLESRELGSRYRERMVRLENDYDLTTWSEGRTGQPRGLPRLARNRFRTFLATFDELAKSDWKAAARLLLEDHDAIQASAATPWEGVDGETHWSVLAEAARLRGLALQASEEAQGMGSDDLLEAYTQRWFEIDRLHLSVRSSCVRVTGLEQLRRVTDLAYFEYVETVNSRLADTIEPEWPPTGTGAGALRDRLWGSEGGRRAVLVVDALRWDLGHELSRRLQAEVQPVVATIPSTTPFGMSALLPISDGDPEVDFERGTSIRIEGGPDLATRNGRKSFLEAELSERGVKCVFLDLDELLQGAPIPAVDRVVVFDNTIDEQGHKGTEEFPVLTEQLIGKLRRAVEKLQEAGLDEVHVVTDHGFLLLPKDMVNGLGKPTVNVNQVLRRESRWAALKAGAPVSGLIRLKLPLSKQAIELGFPRGVRTLVVTDDFIHGGVSLQECVIPHVVSRLSLGPVRTEVNVEVATQQLTGGTIPLVITPYAGGGTFGTPIPLRLRAWVESAGAEVSDALDLEVRADAEELKPPLYLREGVNLAAGTELTLRVIDEETGRDLASIPMTLKVDWE